MHKPLGIPEVVQCAREQQSQEIDHRLYTWPYHADVAAGLKTRSKLTENLIQGGHLSEIKFC